MPPMRLIRAGGALVWRLRHPGRQVLPGDVLDEAEIEVLLVHRPQYHDWSWPKGKIEGRETIPVAAVREVEEETGHVISLGAPLPSWLRADQGGPLLGGNPHGRRSPF